MNKVSVEFWLCGLNFKTVGGYFTKKKISTMISFISDAHTYNYISNKSHILQI